MTKYRRTTSRRFCLLLLPVSLLAVVNSLSVRGADDSDEKPTIARSVVPSDTDPRIDRYSGNGYEHSIYYDPAAKPRDLLLVFLPGTGGKGRGSRAFNTLAAKEGYHVVSLAYPSDVSMSTFHASADPDCFLKARENIIYGKMPFQRLSINRPNSIVNRLQKLLEYLAEKYPDEKWDQFLTDNHEIDWSKVVVAGQSQGGGHAALIGMQHEVARVLMFGAPKDFNVHFNKPATWYSEKSATPIDRFFSFVHRADEGHGCTYPQQLENYRAMKLLPRYPVINVDDHQPPYDHTRLFTSQKSQQSPHGSIVTDKTYADAWRVTCSPSR